jgi:membrane fusion protein, multidrug efflux system
MTRNRWMALAVAALIGAGGAWYLERGHPPPALEAPPGPVAHVKVIPLRRERIEETLTAYGTVVAAPGEARTFSVPFECRVRKIFVTGGQVLSADTPLLEIEPSPDTQLQFDQARIERDSAAEQLKLVEQRLEMKLATRQDLLQAQQRVHDAESRMQSMERRGMDGPRAIRADAPGVVSQIAVQAGQIVPAGAPLLETIGERQITVRLGIESGDVARLQTGQAVRLLPVNPPPSRVVNGRIRLITQRVNPDTRLVDVFVAPPVNSRLLLNEYVEGRIVIAGSEAWVAPRAAVLPAAGGDVLYTIENNHAVKHVVRLGLENATDVQVIGNGLQEGQSVVVAGNSELRDGMAVLVEPN